MNIFSFTGGLGKDAEVKATQSGTTVCDFSVAVNSGYGDHQKTTWVKCAIFGKRAEGNLPPLLVKGQKVAISGELTLEEWGDTEPKNKMLKVVVNSLDLIGEKKAESQGYTPAPQPAMQQPQAPQTPQQAPLRQGQNAAIGQPQAGNALSAHQSANVGQPMQQAPQQQQRPNFDNFDSDIPF